MTRKAKWLVTHKGRCLDLSLTKYVILSQTRFRFWFFAWLFVKTLPRGLHKDDGVWIILAADLEKINDA